MDVLVLIYIVTAIWVWIDAYGRNWSRSSRFAHSAFGWFVGTLLLWIIFFPAYLARRSTAPRTP